MKITSFTKILSSSLILFSLLLILPTSVQAVACEPQQRGNTTFNSSCAFDGEVHGVYEGDLILSEGATLTINAGQTIYWGATNKIDLTPGGAIAINATGQMKQGDLQEFNMARFGFDTYGAALPVRIFENNMFVCTGTSCQATAPSAAGNLIVEGVIKMTGGTPGAGKVLTSDANGVASWQTVSGIPSGLIAAFASACPSGWTEYTAARGRYVVGVVNGGTVEATVGTAFTTNQESRPVGQHNHSIDPPNTVTDNQGSHAHNVYTRKEEDNGTWGFDWAQGGYDYYTCCRFGRPGVFFGTTDSQGLHGHNLNIAAFNSADSGAVAGTNAPYIQLRYCKKD
ncbi:MAG TPA: hypothetical protein VD999_02050 [Vitreimonas sp.]|nr:hypothetical protein [Vitreimonas sp.]